MAVEVPADLVADVVRTSIRVVVQDGTGAVLLFETVDPYNRGLGTWWELPGGGMEPGESVAATAARELAEETGFLVAAAEFGPPTWIRAATYLRRGRRVLQHELVVAVRVTGRGPEPVRDNRTAEELEDYTGHRWWLVPEVVAAGERFFPGRLPELLPAFLAGEPIEEPFEWWN
ncbi:MAG: NUDIX hydrolase [Actinomycetes bacterium]